MNEVMTILLTLCYNTMCGTIPIPFDGNSQQCSIYWQLPVVEYMRSHPGYTLKSVACVMPGRDV